jgi:hypothetical protein
VNCPADVVRHKATPGALADRNPIQKGTAWGASDKHGVFKADPSGRFFCHCSAGDVLGALMGKIREQKHHEDEFHFFMAWAFGLLFMMFFLSMIGA